MIKDGEVRPEGCIYMRTMFGYTTELEGYTNHVRIYRSYTQFHLIDLRMIREKCTRFKF
jgi:hypothetical protein